MAGQVGEMIVPDARFDRLVEFFQPKKIVPAKIQLFDTPGLIQGESKSNGQRLGIIRESAVLIQVVGVYSGANPLDETTAFTDECILSDLQIVTNRIDTAPAYGELRDMGQKVITALGLETTATHMEWFLTPKGEAVFGEIGARPGGGHIVDQMNYTSDIDLFREWARVACHKKFEADRPRKYNCGIVFKRAQGRGRITRIEGLGRWLGEAGRGCARNFETGCARASAR